MHIYTDMQKCLDKSTAHKTVPITVSAFYFHIYFSSEIDILRPFFPNDKFWF